MHVCYRLVSDGCYSNPASVALDQRALCLSCISHHCFRSPPLQTEAPWATWTRLQSWWLFNSRQEHRHVGSRVQAWTTFQRRVSTTSTPLPCPPTYPFPGEWILWIQNHRNDERFPSKLGIRIGRTTIGAISWRGGSITDITRLGHAITTGTPPSEKSTSEMLSSLHFSSKKTNSLFSYNQGSNK